MKLASVVLALSLVAIHASPALAATAAAGPGGFAAGFLTPVVVIAEGEAITFANGDIAPHNLVASDATVPKKQHKKTPWCSSYEKGRCPLFWSETIPLGGSTEVLGLERVAAGGQYGFLCTLHPNMKGTLIVR